MSLLAIALVLIAAVIHAGWNALAKRRPDVLTFFWALTVAALDPLRRSVRDPRPSPPAVVGRHSRSCSPSSLAEVAYGVFLARAYARTDLSLAYPVARGTGVLLVPLAALPIFGDRPTAAAWFGIGLIVLGVVWLHLPAFRHALPGRGWQGPSPFRRC